MPELSYSLFSVPKATKRGITLSFDDSKCFILDKDQEVVTEGVKKGRLYYLECDGTTHSARANVIETNDLWHRRYGHLSSKYLGVSNWYKGTMTAPRILICVSPVFLKNSIEVSFQPGTVKLRSH